MPKMTFYAHNKSGTNFFINGFDPPRFITTIKNRQIGTEERPLAPRVPLCQLYKVFRLNKIVPFQAKILEGIVLGG